MRLAGGRVGVGGVGVGGCLEEVGACHLDNTFWGSNIECSRAGMTQCLICRYWLESCRASHNDGWKY